MSRSAISAAYLIGSFAEAVPMPFLGRLIDRSGPRRLVIDIDVRFRTFLIVFSSVTELFGLTAAIAGAGGG